MEKHRVTRQQHIAALNDGLAYLAEMLASSRGPKTARAAEAALTLATVKLAFDSNPVIQDRLAAVRKAVDASAELV